MKLIKLIGIITLNLLYLNSVACEPVDPVITPNINTIVQGLNSFVTVEIQKLHKTVDLDSIVINIVNMHEILENKHCNNDINYYFPIYANINKKSTVVAECKDLDPWKIYIPINIKFFVNAVAVTRSLPKLHIIHQEDLTPTKITVFNLKQSYFSNTTEVIGLMLKNSVKKNTVLTANLLEKVEHGA